MRHAPGEQADALQFLDLAQCLFGVDAFCDISEDTEGAREATLFVELWCSGDKNGARLAARPVHLDLIRAAQTDASQLHLAQDQGQG